MAGPESGTHNPGLLGSLRRAASTLIEIVQTRIELVVTELEEQGLRAAELAALGLLTLFFVCLAIVLGTLAVVVAYWERNPVAVLGALAALYLVLAVIVGLVWRARARARPRLLSATLAELERDREELTPP